jgi:hypothetical protein
MPSYIFPECVIIAARSRGVQPSRKPNEKMHAFAARVMGVPDSHIHFSVANSLVYVHYSFPDLLQRDSLELAATISKLGVPAETVAQRIPVLPPSRAYDVLLFVKNVPMSYAIQLLSTRSGITAATTWQPIPSVMTRLLLNRTYSASVLQSKAGVAAADANPDGFSIADFSAYFSTTAADFARTRTIIQTERNAPQYARTYRILMTKYTAGVLNAAKRDAIATCLAALTQNCYQVHSDDAPRLFDTIHKFACSAERQADRSEIKAVACIVIPTIVANTAASINFDPNSNTPWWFIQLLHRSSANMVRSVCKSTRISATNARFVLAPYQPQYIGRWPRALHSSVEHARSQFSATPHTAVWQAVLMQATVQLVPWTERRHHVYPKSFSSAVFSLTICITKSQLPIELLRCILKFCFPSDFHL